MANPADVAAVASGFAEAVYRLVPWVLRLTNLMTYGIFLRYSRLSIPGKYGKKQCVCKVYFTFSDVPFQPSIERKSGEVSRRKSVAG